MLKMVQSAIIMKPGAQFDSNCIKLQFDSDSFSEFSRKTKYQYFGERSLLPKSQEMLSSKPHFDQEEACPKSRPLSYSGLLGRTTLGQGKRVEDLQQV